MYVCLRDDMCVCVCVCCSRAAAHAASRASVLTAQTRILSRKIASKRVDILNRMEVHSSTPVSTLPVPFQTMRLGSPPPRETSLSASTSAPGLGAPLATSAPGLGSSGAH